jgi:inorganic pyrophosphatase
MPALVDLPLRDGSGAFRVVVEAPRGSSVKLKYEPETGAFALSRALPLGVTYPYDWGFFPSTRAPDGDPLDAMVLFDSGTYPGVVIPSTPIGVIRVVQRERGDAGAKTVRNDRVIVVPAEIGRYEHVRELPKAIGRELEEFFIAASKLAGKDLTVEGWDGPAEARETILRASDARQR